MTKEQILEGRQKCCVFMELKPVLGSDGFYSWRDGVFFSVREKNRGVAMDSIVKYAKYDSDWNWLMGVVKKIGEICQDTLSIEEEDSLFDADEWHSIEDILPSSDIMAAFQSVVEFIQSYNDNSSK